MARTREQYMEEDGLPPLPVTMPAVTPVAHLKNQTAMSKQLTDTAARDLYATPTHVTYADREHNHLGHYPWSMPANRFVDTLNGVAPSHDIYIDQWHNEEQARDTMMHEYAHKYHDQEMPQGAFEAWNRFGPALAGDYAKGRVERDYGGKAGPSHAELYATQVEMPPWQMPAEVRAFYPFYKEEAFTPPPPDMASQMRPFDFAKARQEYFSPQQWVKERDVHPRGYLSTGEPNVTPLPFPRQFQLPHFPTIGMYDAWTLRRPQG